MTTTISNIASIEGKTTPTLKNILLATVILYDVHSNGEKSWIFYNYNTISSECSTERYVLLLFILLSYFCIAPILRQHDVMFTILSPLFRGTTKAFTQNKILDTLLASPKPCRLSVQVLGETRTSSTSLLWKCRSKNASTNTATEPRRPHPTAHILAFQVH